MEKLPIDKKTWLRDRAREMRRQPSLAERLLWLELHGWHRLGLRFRRQYVIGPYIADVACPAARLVIELDGSSHDGTSAVDEQRSAYLAATGWEVIRFHNLEVVKDARGAARGILHKCTTRLGDFGVTFPWQAAARLRDYN